MTEPTKYLLDESRLPTYWYNIAADLPVPCRRCCIRDPSTVGPADWNRCFLALIQQEMATEREIEIPRRSVRSIGCGDPVRSTAPAG